MTSEKNELPLKTAKHDMEEQKVLPKQEENSFKAKTISFFKAQVLLSALSSYIPNSVWAIVPYLPLGKGPPIDTPLNAVLYRPTVNPINIIIPTVNRLRTEVVRRRVVEHTVIHTALNRLNPLQNGALREGINQWLILAKPRCNCSFCCYCSS